MEKEKSKFDYYIDYAIKLIPVLIGIIYFLGAIVISIRLSVYGIPAYKFFDINYFSAGIPLALMIAGLIFFYRLFQKIRLTEIQLKIIMMVFVVLYFVAIVVGYIGIYNKMTSKWFTIIPGIAYLLMFILIPIYSQNQKEKYFKIVLVPAYIFLLITSVIFAIAIYPTLPQSYGGGRPELIYFYVDSEKTPQLLIDDTVDMEGNVARTVPLYLIHYSSESYIVTIDPNCAFEKNNNNQIVKECVFTIPKSIIFTIQH